MKPNDIPGWYDWDEWNKATVAALPADAVYVEVGCFLGKSTSALAEHIAASGKNIELNAVDTFALKTGDDPALLLALGSADAKALKPKNGVFKFRKVFEAHLQAVGVHRLVHIEEKPSLEAAADFDDAAVDVVFIDADHSYDAVMADIKAWWPKIKAGGVMAGHDIYTYDTVYRGVMDAAKAQGLTVKIIAEQNIWVIQK